MGAIENFHHAGLSLIQSAINHVLAHEGTARPGLSGEHPGLQRVNQHLAALAGGNDLPAATSSSEVCLKLLAECGWALVTHNQVRQKEIADEYEDSPCDPGWLQAVAGYIEHYWIEGQKPMYYDATSGRKLVYPLPTPPSGRELVVGVLGDWGTGEPVAQVVIDQLFQYHRPDVVLHVGDIYYSGTLEEAEHNFRCLVDSSRAKWAPSMPVYTIPGNHDYYSGGEGFYTLISQLNAGQPQEGAQEASFFSLVGPDWQLQAMDTGYFDHDLLKVADDITRLHDSEAVWHREQIEAAAAGRRVILFSHHQLFSAFLNIGATASGNQGGKNFNPYLAATFGDLIEAGKVSAWFWGHEHLLEVYDPYQGLAVGRCVGHSAFPVFDNSDAYQVRYPQRSPACQRVGAAATARDGESWRRPSRCGGPARGPTRAGRGKPLVRGAAPLVERGSFASNQEPSCCRSAFRVQLAA